MATKTQERPKVFHTFGELLAWWRHQYGKESRRSRSRAETPARPRQLAKGGVR